MKFNVNKFVLIRCSRSPNPAQHNYHLDNNILDVREEHSYLGFLLNKTLSWSNHITKIATKASQVFNFLRHNLSNYSSFVKASVYFTIVHPIMEYTASVWDPYQQIDIQTIEKVQRRAARWVMSYYNRCSNVSSMLETLN